MIWIYFLSNAYETLALTCLSASNNYLRFSSIVVYIRYLFICYIISNRIFKLLSIWKKLMNILLISILNHLNLFNHLGGLKIIHLKVKIINSKVKKKSVWVKSICQIHKRIRSTEKDLRLQSSHNNNSTLFCIHKIIQFKHQMILK